MQAVRHLLAQRRLALLICAAALLLKLFVPTGYMIAADHGRLMLTVCSGIVPQPATHAMPDHGTKDHGTTETPCAFAGLSAPLIAAVDGVLLAAAIALVAALALHTATRVAPIRACYWRPPLRAPPLPR